MSKTLLVVRTKLDELIGDNAISGTTSADGATDMKTAIDASLARYPDDWFQDWYLYMTVALEEKKVKTFLSPSGTLTVYEAFAAQVATSKAYTLSRFSIADKLAAINRALVDSYPYFYDRITGVLLGQGSTDQEYLLTSIIGDTFSGIPQQLYIHDCYSGDHTGATEATKLTDSSQNWDDDELIGHIVYNTTDGCYATITDNDSTTVTAAIADCSVGTNKYWTADDKYLIAKNLFPSRTLNYSVITGDILKFYANVKDTELILCVGQSQLVAFTTDVSITELNTDEQAEIIALKGAANLYRKVIATIDSSEVADFKAQADKWEWDYWYRIRHRFMPPMVDKIPIDWSWSV